MAEHWIEAEATVVTGDPDTTGSELMDAARTAGLTDPIVSHHGSGRFTLSAVCTDTDRSTLSSVVETIAGATPRLVDHGPLVTDRS